jgi:hypothetical protein
MEQVEYSSYELSRIRYIESLISSEKLNMRELRRASQEGLISENLRKKVWPILLEVDIEGYSDYHPENQSHRENSQVEKDIERSLWRFTGDDVELRITKRKNLRNVINSLLAKHEDLNYYQGYHDIASVFIMIFDEKCAFALLERISRYYIHFIMENDLMSVSGLLLKMIPLIGMIDTNVYEFLINSSAQPYFALSWVITWFSHSIETMNEISRLFDFFLASHPLMPFYFSIALLMSKKKELSHVECEYSAVHKFFTSLLQEDTVLDFDYLIEITLLYYQTYPPWHEELKIDEIVHMKDYPFDWMSNIIVTPKEHSKFTITNLSILILIIAWLIYYKLYI